MGFQRQRERAQQRAAEAVNLGEHRRNAAAPEAVERIMTAEAKHTEDLVQNAAIELVRLQAESVGRNPSKAELNGVSGQMVYQHKWSEQRFNPKAQQRWRETRARLVQSAQVAGLTPRSQEWATRCLLYLSEELRLIVGGDGSGPTPETPGGDA